MQEKDFTKSLLLILQRYEFSSKSQHGIGENLLSQSCCWYYKGTNFQANHNTNTYQNYLDGVVADTTKVRIFKQITTWTCHFRSAPVLLLILQRYEFSSKSQPDYQSTLIEKSCCWYYKGTNFQANHNPRYILLLYGLVVADTTKVRIFKQITTPSCVYPPIRRLLLILQRYEFSSKSQQYMNNSFKCTRCCWYYKGTNFQANHNHGIIYLT